MQNISWVFRSPDRYNAIFNFSKTFWNIFSRQKPGYRGLHKDVDEKHALECLLWFQKEALYSHNIFETAGEFLDKLFRGKERTYVEKTPIHCLHAGDIRLMFPKAIFVLCERDIDEVTKSFLRQPWSSGIEYRERAAVTHYITTARALLKNDKKTIINNLDEFVESPDYLISKLVEHGIPKGWSDGLRESWKKHVSKERCFKFKGENEAKSVDDSKE